MHPFASSGRLHWLNWLRPDDRAKHPEYTDSGRLDSKSSGVETPETWKAKGFRGKLTVMTIHWRKWSFYAENVENKLIAFERIIRLSGGFGGNAGNLWWKFMNDGVSYVKKGLYEFRMCVIGNSCIYKFKKNNYFKWNIFFNNVKYNINLIIRCL